MTESVDKFKTKTIAPVVDEALNTTKTIADEAFDSLTLEDRVKKALEDMEMTMEDAREIVDALFTTGVYTEVLPIRRGMNIKFRTRTASEEHRLKNLLIDQGDVTVAERNYTVQIHNLACSLMSFGDRDLGDGISEAEYVARKEFLMGLPTVVVDLLCSKLSDFDMRVLVSCQDPVLKDF